MKRCQAAIAALALSSPAAGQEQHSALAAHGDVAAQIALLTWALLALATVVFVAVIAATWIALQGPSRWRALLANQRMILLAGFAFPVAVLTVLLIVGLRLTGTLSARDVPDAIKIDVRGEQWWWRVRYRLPDRGNFESANEVRIPVGRPVVFTLTSADVIHSFWIPSLAGKMDMIPGRITSLRVSATRPGVYRGACAEYCGGPHAWMALSVIAMPAGEFDAWLDTAAQPPPRLGAAAQRGQDLFMRAGCAGCHSVAGTAAKGAIGPSLTKLGTRRTIGAGALPMSEQNLARFIADGQDIKPDNKMPPFKIFSADELNALVAYLVALR